MAGLMLQKIDTVLHFGNQIIMISTPGQNNYL
jgi:hypothetical protein